MRIPKRPVRTTWRADWLVEFSMALAVLAFLTKEVAFILAAAIVLSALAILGLLFYRRLGALRTKMQITAHISKTRMLLGDCIEGDLTVRNGSRFSVHIPRIRPDTQKGLICKASSSGTLLLRPGVALSSRLEILARESGQFQIHGYTLTFTDERALFESEVQYTHVGHVEILPVMRMKLPLTPLRLYGGAAETNRRASTGIDYAGTRRYGPGDEHYRIEWKATARLGTLMIREFHLETQSALQIMIDAGRTMRQRSYVATRLDEALAVAQLLLGANVGSGERPSIWVYDETDIIRVVGPLIAEEQLLTLRALALDLKAKDQEEGSAKTVARPRVTWSYPADSLSNERIAAFMQLLRRKLGSDQRRTGVFKALREIARTSPGGQTVILTDLQTNGESLLGAVSSSRSVNRTIAVQIGAPWRFSEDVEEAYRSYERNVRTLKRFRHLGLVVLDVEPERLMTAVSEELRGRVAAKQTS